MLKPTHEQELRIHNYERMFRQLAAEIEFFEKTHYPSDVADHGLGGIRALVGKLEED